MVPSRFDALTRSLAVRPTRRGVLKRLAGVLALGLLGSLPRVVSSRKGKRKKPKKNAFGCLNVGKPCRGKNGKCCSGICQGKRPKKGKKDKSRCVGHDATSCLVGQAEVACGGTQTVNCITSAGRDGRCETTTGNAAFCRAFGVSGCFACKTDSDCQTHCGPGAACFPCTSCPEGTACSGIDDFAGFPCQGSGD